MSLREMLRIPSNKDFGSFAVDRLKKNYDARGLDDLISDLMFLVDNGFYSKLLDVYANWDEPVPLSHPESAEIASKSKLLILAHENLKHSPVKLFSDLIDFFSFTYLYPFLEWVYSMYLERQLTAADVRKLLSGDIGERIVLCLEDFDKIERTPEITPEFFQKLKKLKWRDRKTEKLYTKIRKIIVFYAFKEYGSNETSFNVRQIELVLFLAGCSAVNEGEEKIDENDVIRAYRTLFKIIKTDLSKLID
ncbi:MAG: hypothetical protein FJ150_08880 [Euryarchaeota archaeon]|nr:hypothetical protein [Euryarchaeota archaeon]